MSLFDIKGLCNRFKGFSSKRPKPASDTFLVFDVETPNRNNDRISSISVTKMIGPEIIWTKSTLVNPEVPFDRFNIRLTGIQPHEANKAPIFPEIWADLLPELEGSIFVAHNAPFDLTVLAKTCSAYQLDFHPILFIDTVIVTRDMVPNLNHHRLNNICDYLGIALDHHNAQSDCRACAEILRWAILHTSTPIDHYADRYYWDFGSAQKTRPSSQISDKTKAINELQELLCSVSADGKITESETYEIYSWLIEHEDLHGNFPFDRIYTAITDALEDGVLEPEELNRLLIVCQSLIDPVHHVQACQCSDVSGKLVCLTGDFASGSKAEIEEKLAEKGAIIKNNVVLKLDYLIVGELGSASWCSGNYGTKVKKALEYQSKGCAVKIIREVDVVSLLK